MVILEDKGSIMSLLFLVLTSFGSSWEGLYQRSQLELNTQELYAVQKRFPNWGDCYLRVETAREHAKDMVLLYWEYPGDYKQDYYLYLESVDHWIGIYMLVMITQDSSTTQEMKQQALVRLREKLGEELYYSGKLPLPYDPLLQSKAAKAREHEKRYYKPRSLPGLGSRL